MKLCNCIALLAAFVSMAFLALYIVFVPHPAGSVEIAHKHGKARILKERATAIPHIYADDFPMAGYALGYLHGQDRLWQINQLRAFATGKLSEIYGEKTLEVDKTLRILGLEQSAHDILENEPNEQLKSYIKHYAEGINKAVEDLVALPVEFWVLNTGFKKWRAVDSMTIYKLQHFMVTQGWGSEMTKDFLEVVFKDTPEMVDRLLPESYSWFNPHDVNVVSEEEMKETGQFEEEKACPNCESTRTANQTWYREERGLEDIPEELKPQVIKGASNNWAIHGNHTKSGKPILVNDPHLGNSIPSVWYLASMTWKEGQKGENYLSGAFQPGVGFCPTGKSKHMMFSITILPTDASDLYEEKIEGDKYLFEGEWRPLIKRQEKVLIKGQEPYVFDVKLTHHGPIISDMSKMITKVVYNGSPIIPVEGDISMRWTGHKVDDNSITCLAGLISSKSVPQAVEILKKMDGVNFHWIIADDKNIGYVSGGAFPKRVNPKMGNRISRGWVAENEWDGYLGPEARTAIINPAKGFVATANNRVAPTGIGSDLPTTGRAVRIDAYLKNLLKEKSGEITAQDMKDMLGDHMDRYVLDKISMMVKIVRKGDTKGLEDSLHSLEEWDGAMAKELEAPTLYHFWETYFLYELAKHQIPNDYIRMSVFGSYKQEDFLFGFWRDLDTNPQLFEEICSKYHNILCGDVLTKALKRAQTEFEALKDKTWGSLHHQYYPHIPFTQNSVLRQIFDRSVPSDGNRNTINVGVAKLFDFIESGRMDSKHSANYKMILDSSDPASKHGFYSVDTGNQPNLLSGHYFDQNEKHLNQELFPILIEDQDVRKVGYDATTFNYAPKKDDL